MMNNTERTLMAAKEREVLAVDIDDVCLNYGSGFARFNNRVGWTLGLKPQDYTEQWGQLWGGSMLTK